MGITSLSGAYLVYGEGLGPSNTDIGPSGFAWGQAFSDTREPFAYEGATNITPKVHGFPQQQLIQTINATIYPSALLAISPLLVDVEPGVPIPLITVAAPGATPGMTVRESGTGRLIHNVLMLDDFNLIDYYGTQIATTASSFDQFGNVSYWDPSKLSSRRISLGGGGNPNEFFITGIDTYGYLMTDTISTEAIGGSFVISRKAFKGIISIIPTQVDSSPFQTAFFTTPYIGVPIRYDYPYSVMAYTNGVLDSTSTDYESSLYSITGITPLAGILTITIAPTNSPFGGQAYTLPIGSHITITRCNPSSYNDTYTVLTSGPGTLTVASTNVDAYVAGGSIFCDQGGLETNDVRGVYVMPVDPTDPVNLIIYQSVTLQNMLTSVGQFGIPQFHQ